MELWVLAYPGLYPSLHYWVNFPRRPSVTVGAIGVGVRELPFCQLGYITTRTFGAPRSADAIDEMPFAGSLVSDYGTARQAADC